MTFFTGSGDNGTTKTFGCDQRISKSSMIAEALGAMDEINSFLGLCKVRSVESGFELGGKQLEYVVHGIQQNIFIIQAELAGAEMTIGPEKVSEAEGMIHAAENELPPIRTFFISGGTELAALFDVARTMARRAERRVVAVKEEGKRPLGADTLAYMNRLSSLLYALARLSNHKSGINEEPPSYK